ASFLPPGRSRPRAPRAIPGYLSPFSNGSGGQSLSTRRLSSHKPNRSGSGPVGGSKQGSLTSPRDCQRVLSPNFRLGCEDSVLRKSSVPLLLLEIVSQNRSLPPVHTIQVLRPLTSAGVSDSPPSIALK